MSDVRKYLTDTVDIISVTRSQGSRTTSTTSGVAAWVTYETERILSGGGDERRTRTIVFLEPTVSINVGDEIIVDGVTRPVVEIRKLKTLSADHHLEVELG